jgi:SAM (Sterile alpha motif) domain-containing protein
MSEVRDWLRRNNLEQYADAFEANDIGFDILPELNEQELEFFPGNRRQHRAEASARRLQTAPAFDGLGRLDETRLAGFAGIGRSTT